MGNKSWYNHAYFEMRYNGAGKMKWVITPPEAKYY